MLKIDLAQIKKTTQWIEANNKDVNVQVYTGDGNKMVLKVTDRLGSEVGITLFNDTTMLPKN